MCVQESVIAPTRNTLSYLALHPWLLYVAVVVLVSISVYPLTLLYLDLYSSYVDGCTKGAASNGTLLTQNAGALFYNAASVEGQTTRHSHSHTHTHTSTRPLHSNACDVM
jgi:hypothetical protein